MQFDTILTYKQEIFIRIHVTTPASKFPRDCGVIEFTYLNQKYVFSPTAWEWEYLNSLRHQYNIYNQQKFDTAIDDRTLFENSALDIMRGIWHIFYARQTNILNYAVYHLKHYPNTDGHSYDDSIMESACQAIIDCNFFAMPSMIYEKITLANEGKNSGVQFQQQTSHTKSMAPRSG
jgi:hypothetical protein